MPLMRARAWLRLVAGLGASAISLCTAQSLAPTPADFNPSASLNSSVSTSVDTSVDASPDVQRVVQWVVGSQDNRRAPFAILDKRAAKLFAFDANGGLVDSTPILLGAAVGDDSVPGIGERPLAQVQPHERTTPAGRFDTEPGRNVTGEPVIWIDYDAAVSMHRVRLGNVKEQRMARLSSPDPSMRRISYGCINVPVKFFDTVIWPVFGRRRGVVYVLPETRPLHDVFPALAPRTAKTPG